MPPIFLTEKTFPFHLRLAQLLSVCALLALAPKASQGQEGAATQASPLTGTNLPVGVSAYNALVFEPGKRVPFQGIFTHTEPVFSMDDQIASAKSLMGTNPYIAGVTIKLEWKRFHPEKDVVYWDKLEELIKTISDQGKIVNLGLIPGLQTPQWVYDEGAIKIGPIKFLNEEKPTPVAWDKTFMKIFSQELRDVAARYADDPRVSGIIVLGHNYKGEEMHAPDPAVFKDHGFSPDVVLENWKYWIDLYGELFPKKKLNLTVSQMYKGEGMALPQAVAKYFVEKYQGRAVLQTDQLNGREEARQESGEICREFSKLAPHCHEMVGSFMEQAERQGSPEMVVYTAVKYGNPLYFQLWRRDCLVPQYARNLSQAMERLGGMSPEEIKAVLVKEGLYVEKSTFEEGKLKPNVSFKSPADYTEYLQKMNPAGASQPATQPGAPRPLAQPFNSEKDLISLHYDHAPDRDDGHSAAADRTLLESMFGRKWIAEHALAVSGAYGLNERTFRPASDKVMDACFNDCGGWLAAHTERQAVVDQIFARWSATLNAGGDVWVKEGGQSDLTAAVVRRINETLPTIDTTQRIRVIQHSAKFNENNTTPESLAFTKAHTQYINIPNANEYLNQKPGDAGFIEAAKGHAVYGAAWQAAFAYLDPATRLDFSDTGELMYILGLGEIGIAEFGLRFLAVAQSVSSSAVR